MTEHSIVNRSYALDTPKLSNTFLNLHLPPFADKPAITPTQFLLLALLTIIPTINKLPITILTSTSPIIWRFYTSRSFTFGFSVSFFPEEGPAIYLVFHLA